MKTLYLPETANDLMPQPLQIFIAYARKDASYLEELRIQLTPLERNGKVKIWYDGEIEPGVVWEAAIKENLYSADIILLLISADAIASDYFYDKEMKDALARHTAGTARVVPFILRPCAWQETPLKELQALPRDGLAVTEWPNRDAAYANAVNSLNSILNSLHIERAAAVEQLALLKKQKEDEVRRKAELEKQRLESLALQQAEKQRQQQAAAEQKQREETQCQAAAEAKQRQRLLEEASKRKREEIERIRLQILENQRIERERKKAVSAIVQQHKSNAPATNWLLMTTFTFVFLLFIIMWLSLTATNSKPDSTAVQMTQPDNFPNTTKPTVVAVEQPLPETNSTKNSAGKREASTNQSFNNRKSGLEMMYVIGGNFEMGQGDAVLCCDTCIKDNCINTVYVIDFIIGKYEVTQTDWKAVMGTNPSNFKCDLCPVEQVSWDDIQDFLRKANAKYDKAYRLPTEAEWEYAARGGICSKGFAYGGSNSPGSVAWYDGNSGRKTHPVGGKAANELGLYDMSGNVWEWCSNNYIAYDNCEPDKECLKGCKVVRGGSWYRDGCKSRSVYRGKTQSSTMANHIGFRLAQ